MNIDGATVPARIRADEAFTGVNIPPRQSFAQRVRFFVGRAGRDSRDQLDLTPPDWIWSPSDGFETMTLRWASVRSPFLRRKLVRGALDLHEPWKTVDTEITYLHRAP